MSCWFANNSYSKLLLLHTFCILINFIRIGYLYHSLLCILKEEITVFCWPTVHCMYWLGDRFSSLLLLPETWNNFVWNGLCLQQISPPKQVEKPIVLAEVIIHIARINQFVQETLKPQRLESTEGEAAARSWLWELPGAAAHLLQPGARSSRVPAPLPEQPGQRKFSTHS